LYLVAVVLGLGICHILLGPSVCFYIKLAPYIQLINLTVFILMTFYIPI